MDHWTLWIVYFCLFNDYDDERNGLQIHCMWWLSYPIMHAVRFWLHSKCSIKKTMWICICFHLLHSTLMDSRKKDIWRCKKDRETWHVNYFNKHIIIDYAIMKTIKFWSINGTISSRFLRCFHLVKKIFALNEHEHKVVNREMNILQGGAHCSANFHNAGILHDRLEAENHKEEIKVREKICSKIQ